MNVIEIKGMKVEVPIVQGGMGVGVSLSGLATAVINEGGVGTISAAQIGFKKPGFSDNVRSCYAANVAALKDEVQKVRDNSNGFLAVNIMTAGRQYEELAKTAVESGVNAIVSGAGMPFDLPKYVKGTKTAAIPIIANSRVLNVIMKKWDKKYGYVPDAIVIEGPEAGGHLGVKKSDMDKKVETLMERLTGVLDYMKENNLKFPVIVAGGIFTASDVKRFLDAGADMVQLGTRFIATDECDADFNFKQNLVNCQESDMLAVESPVGYPACAIKSPMTERLENGHLPIDKCLGCVIPCGGPIEATPYCITDHLIKSVTGDLEDGLFFTGSNGYRVDKIVSVHDLIDELLMEVR